MYLGSCWIIYVEIDWIDPVDAWRCMMMHVDAANLQTFANDSQAQGRKGYVGSCVPLSSLSFLSLCRCPASHGKAQRKSSGSNSCLPVHPLGILSTWFIALPILQVVSDRVHFWLFPWRLDTMEIPSYVFRWRKDLQYLPTHWYSLWMNKASFENLWDTLRRDEKS